MIFPSEYNWIDAYLSSDLLWCEDTLNWENIIDLITTDISLYSFLTTSIFHNSFFFTDTFTKLSFFDILLLNDSNSLHVRELFDAFIWDASATIQLHFLPLQFLFYTDYQDFIAILFYQSPELILALNDYLQLYFFNNFARQAPVAVFDIFSDSITTIGTEFVENLIFFFLFAWLVLFALQFFRISKWSLTDGQYFGRVVNYLFFISKEARLQFEAFLIVFFFFIFYWSMLIAAFDDDKEEIIELMDTTFFYFFAAIIAFLIYKYSIHYFAFLEASFNEGRSVSFIAKQFFRDFINTFALFLRFFILLIRLNVYDSLDDFYDSYYIFVGDFDDDEYFYELFYNYASVIFFNSDANDDKIFYLPDEHEIFNDAFVLYFVSWAKFFTFIFFILEEILRLSLAFYICYLITFEVHAVNASYVEDNFLLSSRKR